MTISTYLLVSAIVFVATMAFLFFSKVFREGFFEPHVLDTFRDVRDRFLFSVVFSILWPLSTSVSVIMLIGYKVIQNRREGSVSRKS